MIIWRLPFLLGHGKYETQAQADTEKREGGGLQRRMKISMIIGFSKKLPLARCARRPTTPRLMMWRATGIAIRRLEEFHRFRLWRSSGSSFKIRFWHSLSQKSWNRSGFGSCYLSFELGKNNPDIQIKILVFRKTRRRQLQGEEQIRKTELQPTRKKQRRRRPRRRKPLELQLPRMRSRRRSLLIR